MSSVLVKGMKLPRGCRECPFINAHMWDGSILCLAMGKQIASNHEPIEHEGRHTDCPLVEVEDDDRGHAMSAINREDTLEAILSRLAKWKEPCPPWIYATIRECLDDLPSLPSGKPLVYDGFYLCDKKPGACPSWERKGWTKCESKHCNRTSRVDHALKLPDADDGWIPYTGHDQNIEYGRYLVQTETGVIVCGTYSENGFVFPFCSDVIVAFRPLPEPYKPKEDK